MKFNTLKIERHLLSCWGSNVIVKFADQKNLTTIQLADDLSEVS